MKIIALPSGELLRSFVSGLFREYMQTQCPFLGDLLARHAPQTAVALGQVTDFRQLFTLENALFTEMMPFGRGLLQAIYNESISTSTEWGRAKPSLHHAVHEYLAVHSGMWQEQRRMVIVNDEERIVPGHPAVTRFRRHHLEPLYRMTTAWWSAAVAENPWRLWHCYYIGNDLIVEPGEDYRAADWMRLNQQGVIGQELEIGYTPSTINPEFDAINAACLEQLPGRRKPCTTVRTAPSTALSVSRPEIRPFDPQRDLVAILVERRPQTNRLHDSLFDPSVI
jgi:hypothetical protein